MATRKHSTPKSKPKPKKKLPAKSTGKPAAKKKAARKPAKPAAPKKKPSAKSKPAPRTSPTSLQPDTTAPPLVRPLHAAPPRPRRVSIGEALAQLNAAALEGMTKELVPFGLNPDVPLTPSTSLASLIGPEPRPLSALVTALESWDGDGADLMLMDEARALLDTVPRIAEDLEAFLRRNCTT